MVMNFAIPYETHRIPLTETVCLRIVYAELEGSVKHIWHKYHLLFYSSYSYVANNLWVCDKSDYDSKH